MTFSGVRSGIESPKKGTLCDSNFGGFVNFGEFLHFDNGEVDCNPAATD